MEVMHVNRRTGRMFLMSHNMGALPHRVAIDRLSRATQADAY
jgi:hypothetical protein